MPLGRHHVVYHSAPLISSKARLYRNLIGVVEFHSHIRWPAIRRWIDPAAQFTLEVGAGEGLMTVEVAKRVRGEVVASEFDQRLIEMMRLGLVEARISNVTTSQDDLRTLSVGRLNDQVIMADVLEHIDDHELALQQLARSIRPDGRLIISVPTPRYPIVFGRPFHEEIGHVRDGYLLADLAPLLDAAGFDVTDHRYYTGPVASWFCSRWYRDGRWGRRRKMLVLPFAKAVSIAAEPLSNESNAASLAVLAIRRPAA